jgi:GNAT superfamily N-acetyltransferase
MDADVMRFGHGEGDAFEIVATVDGVIAGVSALSPHEENEGWVSKVFVDAAMRRQGAGKALMRAIVEEGRRRGYAKLGLRTRTIFREAVALYEGTGWTRGPAPCSGPCDRTYFLVL